MRYAIYYTAPVDAELTRLGATWLGRDAVTDTPLTQPEVEGLTADEVASLTTDPRRYGFHATLKAPFSLKDGVSEAELVDGFRRFCARAAGFEIPALDVTLLGRFLALTPQPASAELNAFAAACVTAFEPFRAPLSEADIARRMASGLNARQQELLAAWGYPYIFEDFRFHMTLSVKLDDDVARVALQQAAETYFASVIRRPHAIASLGLFCEPERNAPFKMVDVLPLTGALAPTEPALGQAL